MMCLFFIFFFLFYFFYFFFIFFFWGGGGWGWGGGGAKINYERNTAFKLSHCRQMFALLGINSL